MSRLDAAEVAERIACALEAAQVPYAIGGALAMGVHGYPRGTLDVDLNVFVAPNALDSVLATLANAGLSFDAALARTQSEHEGMFVGTLDGLRVDVFVPSVRASP